MSKRTERTISDELATAETQGRLTIPYKGVHYRNERFFHTHLSRSAIHNLHHGGPRRMPMPGTVTDLSARIYWRGLCPIVWAAFNLDAQLRQMGRREHITAQ